MIDKYFKYFKIFVSDGKPRELFWRQLHFIEMNLIEILSHNKTTEDQRRVNVIAVS